MDYGLCLGLFDEKKGPFSLFNNGIPDAVSTDIVTKGILMHGSLGSLGNHNKIENETVLSFPSADLAAFLFVSMHPYYSANEEFPFVVAFTAPLKYQFQLYRDSEELRKMAEEIETTVIDLIRRTKDINLTREKLSKIALLRSSPTMEEPSNLVRLAEEVIFNPISILKKNIKKNLDQAIYGMIVGECIAVSCKNIEKARTIMNALKVFSPHRKLKILELFSGEKVFDQKSYDIIAILPDQLPKNFKGIHIDLERSKTTGGKKSKYCLALIEELLRIENRGPKLLDLLANRRINWLLMSAASLTQISGPESVAAVNAIIQKIDRDSLYLIAKFLENKNPAAYSYLTKQASIRGRVFKSIF